MQDIPMTQLAERFQFNPKWWWDPIPDFFRDRLDDRVISGLMQVQLTKQHAMLKAELQAIEETMKLLG